MEILYCDSKGDRRFSALYAKIRLSSGREETIENLYQKAKRDKGGNAVKKGAPVDHFVVNGKSFPATGLTAYYQKLWEIYFEQNPELLEYARQYDTFVDRYKGHSTNNQGDAIANIVSRKRKGE